MGLCPNSFPGGEKEKKDPFHPLKKAICVGELGRLHGEKPCGLGYCSKDGDWLSMAQLATIEAAHK